MTLILLILHLISFYFSIECSLFFSLITAKIPIYLVTASLGKETVTIYALRADVLICFFLALRTPFLKKNMKIFYTVLYNNAKYHGYTFNIHICHSKQ